MKSREVVTAKSGGISKDIIADTEGKLDESCQIIFEDLDQRNRSQGEMIEKRLQSGLRSGLATQMQSVQKSLQSFTTEAQQVISSLQSSGSAGLRRPRQAVSFTAGSAVVSVVYRGIGSRNW